MWIFTVSWNLNLKLNIYHLFIIKRSITKDSGISDDFIRLRYVALPPPSFSASLESCHHRGWQNSSMPTALLAVLDSLNLITELVIDDQLRIGFISLYQLIWEHRKYTILSGSLVVIFFISIIRFISLEIVILIIITFDVHFIWQSKPDITYFEEKSLDTWSIIYQQLLNISVSIQGFHYI